MISIEYVEEAGDSHYNFLVHLHLGVLLQFLLRAG